MPGTWEVLHTIHRETTMGCTEGFRGGDHSVYRDEVRKCEEAKADLNLEGWHVCWRDRWQASPQDMLTYRVESGYVRHFYLPEHCMEGLHEVDKGEPVRGLWWSRDLYPLGSSGRIFNSHSTIRSWFLRLHWCLGGKNLGTIGITQNTNRVAKLLRFFENCQGKFTVISLGILVLDYSSCSPISTLLTFYTNATKSTLWIFLSCHYLCSRCSNDFVLLLQIIWCNQESKKKQSLEKLCILRLCPSKLSTTNCQKTLIKQRTKDKLLFLLESTRNLEEIILQS